MSVTDRCREPGAARPAVVVATTGVGLVVAAVTGAILLFAPGEDATRRAAGPAPSSAAPVEPGDVTVQDEATVPTTPRGPRGTVATVPPAAAPTPIAHAATDVETGDATRSTRRSAPRLTAPAPVSRDPRRDERDEPGRGHGHHGHGHDHDGHGHDRDGDRDRDRDGDRDRDDRHP